MVEPAPRTGSNTLMPWTFATVNEAAAVLTNERKPLNSFVAPEEEMTFEYTPICVVAPVMVPDTRTFVLLVGETPTPIYPFTCTVSVESSPSVVLPFTANAGETVTFPVESARVIDAVPSFAFMLVTSRLVTSSAPPNVASAPFQYARGLPSPSERTM